LSNIILGGITLPQPTTMPKLDFEPVVDYSEPSVTGRLHNVYRVEAALSEYGDYDTIRFDRKFSMEIIGLTKAEYDSLTPLDGTNTTLRFERDTYTEEYEGNLDMTFFKFDEHLYFDAVNIEFVVTRQIPQVIYYNEFSIGELITPPVAITDNEFSIGDLIPVEPPTITHNLINNTIEMT